MWRYINPISIIILIVIGMLAYILWISSPAHSAKHSLCVSVEDTIEKKQAQFPGSEMFIWLDGQDIQETRDMFNVPGDTIIGLHRSIDPNVLLLFFIDGCYVGMAVMLPKEFQQMRGYDGQ